MELLLITTIPIFLLLVAIGITLIRGKGGWLLAGWNTMSPEKRAKYNQKSLFRFAGCLIILSGVFVVITMVVAYFENHTAAIASIITFMVVLVAGVIYANTSKRFRV
ncbi:MAG: DUF3784 domain-containing protein [Defluviitaleaceae bacterium]|nr:DUF3784 domain-containing protein [Defluviitaleaceae bacterium]